MPKFTLSVNKNALKLRKLLKKNIKFCNVLWKHYTSRKKFCDCWSWRLWQISTLSIIHQSKGRAASCYHCLQLDLHNMLSEKSLYFEKCWVCKVAAGCFLRSSSTLVNGPMASFSIWKLSKADSSTLRVHFSARPTLPQWTSHSTSAIFTKNWYIQSTGLSYVLNMLKA